MDNQPQTRGVNLARFTPKRRAFCQNWLSSGRNAKQAAIAAGYPEHTAKVMGCKLLQDPLVKRYIRKLESLVEEQSLARLNSVYEKLGDCLNRDVAELEAEDGEPRSLRELPKELRSAIDGVKIKRSVKQTTDKEGTTEVDVETTYEYKISSIQESIDKVCKMRGDYASTGNTTVNVDARKVTVLRIPDNGRGPAIEQK